MILQALCDTTSSQSNLTGNKVLATALRLMVEQNTVDSEHIVSVTIFFHNPEAVLLGNCVRRIRVERRCFTLRNFLDLTIQFRSRCLIHLAAFSQTTNTDSLQNTQNTQSVHITGIFRCIKRNLHMALCSQIVDFIRLNLANNTKQTRRIRQIAVMQLDFAHQVVNTGCVGDRSTAHDAVDFITFF